MPDTSKALYERPDEAIPGRMLLIHYYLDALMPDILKAESQLVADYIACRSVKTRDTLCNYLVNTAKLPYYTAKRVWNGYATYITICCDDLTIDDLESELMQALLRAVDSYNESKNVALRTWVIQCMFYQARETIRSYTRGGRTAFENPELRHIRISVDSLVHDTDSVTYADTILHYEDPEPSDPYTLSALKNSITQLPERLQGVVYMRFYDDKTFKQIGDALGVTESRANQLYTKAIKQLNTYMKHAGIDTDAT